MMTTSKTLNFPCTHEGVAGALQIQPPFLMLDHFDKKELTAFFVGATAVEIPTSSNVAAISYTSATEEEETAFIFVTFVNGKSVYAYEVTGETLDALLAAVEAPGFSAGKWVASVLKASKCPYMPLGGLDEIYPEEAD